MIRKTDPSPPPIEDVVRAELQVRIAVAVLERGGLPRSAYKNALVAVRES